MAVIFFANNKAFLYLFADMNPFSTFNDVCASIRFIKGTKPGRNTGFDIDEADLLEMDQCNGVVVASAIFGWYYVISAFVYRFTCV